MHVTRFRSKVDAWVVITLVLAAAMALLAAYALPSRDVRFGLLGPVLLVAVGAGLPLWILLSTSYAVKDRALVIRSGPFGWRIPLSEITRMAPTRAAWSSPALSLDRLRIEYGAGKTVLVSPTDHGAFMRAVSEAADAA